VPSSQPAESNPADRQHEQIIVSPKSISVDYFKGYLSDTGKIVTSPLHADTSDWLKIGGVVAITGGLILVDANIRDFSNQNHSSVADKFASAGQKLGSPLYTIPPVGAFYLYGYLRDDMKARKTSLLAMESLAISTLFTEILKVTAQRDRPNTGGTPYKWEGPHFNLNNVSFCSGHTSSAFSIATVFAEQYKDSPYVPTVAYGLATLAGLSRIYDNKHWASDAFFGAALGYFIGKSVVSFHRDHILDTTNLSLSPDIRPNYNGLTVQYKF
jgi:membrane-associated phospholipid phosphatase